MLKAFAFGEWVPDVAPSGTVTIATNVKPIANGYAPFPSFSAMTSTLVEDFKGGAVFVASDGTATLLAATPSDLRHWVTGDWPSLWAGVTTGRWRFTQFGDNALAANGGTVFSYGLISGIVSNPTNAPNAIDIARVRDFVMALTTDNKAHWSQFNDSSNFTTGTNQSDVQPILGGQGVAIVGGEDGFILRKNGIDRVTYVGSANDIIFQFDEVNSEYGCMARDSVADMGPAFFFLSERGFIQFDRATGAVTPIGEEKFNRWFFSTYAREEIANIWAAIDPRNSLVLWVMPGSPGRIILYNWVLKRGAVVETDITGLFTGFTANTSLDAVDALYPGGLEAIPISLDDPTLSGGNALLLAVNSALEVGTFAGANLEASICVSNAEPSPTRRSRIRTLRPVTDATNATATINAKARAGDAESVVSTASMRSNGRMPCRANGRYNDITMTIPAGETWSYIQGVEVEFEPGDNR